MSRYFKIAGIVAMMLTTFATRTKAQDISVTVTPVQQILPPQVAIYIDNPGKYFNITLSNSTQEAQNVYLALNLEQTLPASGLMVIVPPKRMPQQPIVVPAGGVHMLTMVEMKTMFNHVPKSEIQMTDGLFDSYTNGTFGLLPEGQYTAQITAYRWDPNLSQPLALSNPKAGICNFTVCYKAQAPQWLTPMVQGVDLSAIAKVDAMNPIFTWTPPVVACNPKATQFSYNFKIVEVLANQQPDDAMDKNPVLYQVNNLLSPQVIVPMNVIKTKFNKMSKYAAQIEAVSMNKNTNMLDYVTIENKGKSPYCLFQFVQNNGNEQEEEEKEETDDDDEWSVDGGGKGEGELDSLYVFSNPDITRPFFAVGDNHKLFTTADIPVEWYPSKFMGGEDGSEPEKIKFEYTVALYQYDDYDADPKKCGKPIFTKKPDKEGEYTITWEDIEDKVSKGDHLMLVVQPKCLNQKSIRFDGDDNQLDFYLISHLTLEMFECSSDVEIANEKPTKKTTQQLMDSQIAIGEYTLIIDQKFGDKIEKVPGKDAYKGTGHIEWSPLGFKTMIAVRFDNLQINTEDQAYGGECESYPTQQQAAESNYEVVDKLFSEWGVDNLIGDSQIPYSDQAYKMAKGEVKNLAQKLDISKYYQYVKQGKAIYDKFLNGPLNDVHLPLAVPKSVNLSPVDLQIVSMKFSPKYATMNIMGVFTLPSCDNIENDVLILGAPRICISPDNVIPATGYVALLGNFVVKDPDTGYKCTFKAPSDVLMPTDGCFIAWKDNEFGKLTVDVDMEIPKLKKVVNGQVTNEKPVLNILWSFYDWDDWLCEDVTIDDFEVSGLSGLTFTAKDIVLDHSKKDNSGKLKFPAEYDKSWLEKPDYADWQGLYCKKIGGLLPKSFQMGNNGNERMEIAIEEMLVDDTGATLTAAVNNIYNGKTGKLGGWSFSIDKFSINFVQNNFTNCFFTGQVGVPLVRNSEGGRGMIDYTCKMLNIKSGVGEGQFAYIFKTEIKEGLSLDCFLAEVDFKEGQNYLLVESAPDELGNYKTNVELVMGGEMTIKGTEWANSKLANVNSKLKDIGLPVELKIGGIHFCGMRIANCDSQWESRFEKEMQDVYKNYKLEGTTLYSGKEFKIGDNVWFSTGRFSYASAEKKLGPFVFSIKEYDFKFLDDSNGKRIKFSINGGIKFLEDFEIGGSAGVSIFAKVNIPQDKTNISEYDLSYDDVELNSVGIDLEFMKCKVKGELDWATNDPDKEGFSGNVEISILDDFLAKIKCNGGYFKNKKDNSNFTYGWFYGKLDPESGSSLTPLNIKHGELGVYYNCSKDGESAKPNKGVLGFIAGLGISAMSESSFAADVTAHVVLYKDPDTKETYLSAITFTGGFEVMSGMLKGDCTISYCDDKKDKYFSLDVTLELSKGIEGGGAIAENVVNKLNELKGKLDSAFEGLKKAPLGRLQGLLNDGGDDNAKQLDAPKNDTKYDGSDLGFKSGLEINVGIKITFKRDGKKCSPTKWYFCLGHPDESLRCRYTFLKFDAVIVSCDIGASGYVVVGNELCDNGNLPEIPPIIRTFLNGEGAGDGVGSIEGASLSKAQKARTQALKDFESQFQTNSGGVMFGAQLYGYLKVNLGLISLDAGATAGFDLSIVKLSDKTYCVNLKNKDGTVRKPGYKGWYGHGQIYGYLYLTLGVHIDIGFWKKDWIVADARVGGVFQFQGLNPSHMTGEARVKLNLMNGWVDIDKYYYFDCGESCAMFAGNALDEFKLFGDMSIGYDDEKGWNYDRRIHPKLNAKPVIFTEAPLEEPFRVIDPTYVNVLKTKYGSDYDTSALEAEAARTFKFKSNLNSQIYLIEFEDSASAFQRNLLKATYRYYPLKRMRYKNIIDCMELNPNKYYMVAVSASAKEIRYGKEIDPETWNDQKRQYEPRSWSKTKWYFFRTKGYETVPDRPEDLQDYVSVIFPSKLNKLKSDSRWGKNYIHAHMDDCQYPTIALNADLSKTSYKQGTLTWNVYNTAKEKVDWTYNQWVTTNNTCVMMPSRKLNIYETGLSGRRYIQLEYKYTGTEYNWEKNSNEWVTKIDTLAVLCVTPYDDTWQEYECEYEKPFTGAKLEEYEWHSYRFLYDHEIASKLGTMGTSKLFGITYNDPSTGFMRLHDPYLFLSYLSNYVFYGGWPLEADRIDANVVNTQSLIYTDKGGVYEGSLSPYQTSNRIQSGAKDIRALNIYSKDQWSKYNNWPLPMMSEGKYAYAMQGQPRAAQFHATPANETRYQKFPEARLAAMVKDYINDWFAPWKAAKQLNPIIQNQLYVMDRKHTFNYTHNTTWSDYELNATAMLDDIQDWYNNRKGGYATSIFNNVCLQIPYYQFPFVFGACLDNAGTKSRINPWKTILGLEKATKQYDTARSHAKNAQYIYAGLYGNDKWASCTYNWHQGLTKHTKTVRANYISNDDAKFRATEEFTYDDDKLSSAMPSAKFTIYRCNAYDFVNGCYVPISSIKGKVSMETFTIKNPLKYANDR